MTSLRAVDRDGVRDALFGAPGTTGLTGNNGDGHVFAYSGRDGRLLWEIPGIRGLGLGVGPLRGPADDPFPMFATTQLHHGVDTGSALGRVLLYRAKPPNVLIPDTYERWFGATGILDPNVYVGPDTTHPNSPYLTYPRAHLLSNAETFLSGFFPQAATVIDPANGWLSKGLSAHATRVYGGSVLFPNIDVRHTDAVFIVGGFSDNGTAIQILDSVQICKASAPAAGLFDAPTQGWDWTPATGSLPSLIHART